MIVSYDRHSDDDVGLNGSEDSEDDVVHSLYIYR